MNSRALLIIVIVFCLGILALLIRLLLANRRKDRIKYGAAAPPQETDKRDLDERVSELVDRDRKSEAIHLVREEKNMSSDDAEDYVESFEQGITFLSTDKDRSLTEEELENKVFELLLQNKKMEAIPLVRENKLIGLKEAKEFVESVEKKHNLG
jgi:ribosomal protein L7/L12